MNKLPHTKHSLHSNPYIYLEPTDYSLCPGASKLQNNFSVMKYKRLKGQNSHASKKDFTSFPAICIIFVVYNFTVVTGENDYASILINHIICGQCLARRHFLQLATNVRKNDVESNINKSLHCR